MIKELTRETFDMEVRNAEGPVLVDFYADWCGPCKMLRPILEEISDERADVTVAAVNIDEQDELADEFEVSSIPCVVVFRNGAEVDRSIGLKPREAIEELI